MVSSISAVAPGVPTSATRLGGSRFAIAGARSHAVTVLQAFAVLAMVIPSDAVIRPIGAVGFPAGLVGMFAFVLWGFATLTGLHDALHHRHPIRTVLCLVWLATLISYVLIDRGAMTTAQLQSADRFLMQLAVITGVALIAAEGLHSLADVRRVLRALTWGGAFCGVVAALQFWLSLDLTPTLRSLPGFTVNAHDPALDVRSGLNRVAGTAIHPIELGVVAAILLPLAIYLLIYDTERKPWERWLPLILIAVAVPVSVSRSAVLGIVLAMGLFVVLMPVGQRLVTLAAAPIALAGVFVTAHGLIGTLASYFGMGVNDASIAHRVNNWPYVESLVRQAPWFGHGGGTFIPTTAASTLHVLDDQYLHTAIELGLVGVTVLGVFLIAPMMLALAARRRSDDAELRLLCAALAGGGLAACVSSAAFDSLSFPMFWCVYALVIGLIGACCRLTGNDRLTSGG